jgi:hypothetical protein
MSEPEDRNEKVSKKVTSKEDIIVKAQAMIRGKLVRNHYKPMINDGFEMILRMSRRLSNGKLYYLSLMRKHILRVQNTTEPFYLITLREVRNINEIYDLEISIEMARKIFGKKDCTKE